MSETKTYEGGCHCGAVRYQATLDLEHPALACNCSMCGRAGTLLVFVPGAAFKLLSGEGELTDYQFGKKHIHHLFCRVCGIKSFARGAGRDGGETFAVNARCLDGVETERLAIKLHDGRSQ